MPTVNGVMLRVAAITAAVLALPASALGARRAETPSTASSIVAKVLSCDVEGDSRSATFYARMDSVQGAARLSVRCQLLERLGRGDSWSRVDVPALRGWRSSQVGVKRFGWKQNVEKLNLGGAYKARVQYRWVAPAGSIVETETKDTPVCRGPVPNLAVGDVAIRRGPTADTRIYRVELENTGRTDADDVQVSLSVDRAVLDTLTVSRLAAGDARTVSFTGPACRREIRVEIDPENTIGERSEEDNSQATRCP